MTANVCYFVGTHGDWGGASRILFNIARKVDRNRFNPILMLSGRGPAAAELEAKGIEYHEWPNDPGQQRPGEFVWQMLKSVKFFRKRQVQLIHFNHTSLGWRPPELMAARLLRIPVLAHCQMPVAKPSPDLRWSRLALMCSEYLARVSDTGSVEKRVVYDLVDLDRFGQGKDIRRELGLASSDVVVSFVGRARRAKGLDMFVAMAKAIRGEHVKFLMTGQRVGRPTADSYGPEEIEKLVAQDGRIRYLGFREDIENVYASSDLIVVPSQKEEPCPAVLIESAACGKPVVATRMGSITEFVRHGQTGFLVDRSDLSGMVGYVGKLISDAELRRQMGKRAKQMAEVRFVREPIARIEAIYASQLH